MRYALFIFIIFLSSCDFFEDENDQFGTDITISDDATLMAVGARYGDGPSDSNSGEVYFADPSDPTNLTILRNASDDPSTFSSSECVVATLATKDLFFFLSITSTKGISLFNSNLSATFCDIKIL